MTEERPIDPETGEPFAGIVLTNARTFCARHAEPFRAGWPTGSIVFQVRAFQLVTAIDGVWAEANRLAGLPEKHPEHDVRRLETALDVKPMCCRLPRAQLLELYRTVAKEVGWTASRCYCGKRALGRPYRIKTSEGVRELPHVCFECVVFQMVSTSS